MRSCWNNAPSVRNQPSIDLELKLAELRRRAMQFRYLSKHHPDQLRGGMWQLSWLPLSGDLTDLLATNAAYRQNEETIRNLTEGLRKHATYEGFRKAQMRLWKTPDYRFVHRRYSGRLQELNQAYGRLQAVFRTHLCRRYRRRRISPGAWVRLAISVFRLPAAE